MPTPPEPSGRSSAKRAAAEPPAAGDLPLPPANGSTGSHTPEAPLSDIIRSGSGSSRTPVPSAESDIAQFLANPSPNTDEQPTVITKAQPGGAVPPPPPVVVPVSAAPPSVAGRRLGHFELIEAVGSGGMAAVLKARDTELGRVVALKILPPEAARDPESVTRFKAEARAAAKLDHDNIARVYFCGEDQGLHFIAFEFVEGINLRQVIDRRGALPAGECVRYMVQVAAGLSHAAERGVVHRDIKPSNILVTPDGRAKIVDMGLARHLGAEPVNGGVTQSGVTLGTFDYISPEQALDPRRADVRSDIYSLGCTFYHALTGRPPVPEGTAARKLRAHQTEEPLDPRELNPAIPDELAAVLARMMAKDPDVRYQTPADLIAHLRALAERLDLSDTVPGDQPAAPTDFMRTTSTRAGAWWLVGAVAVAVAAVAFVISTGDPGPAPGAPGRDFAKVPPIEPVERPDPPVRPVPPVVPLNELVRTPAELARRLADPATERVALAAETFDLTLLDRTATFTGPKLELVGAPGGGTRLIVTAGRAADAPGALALKAGKLTVRNVWFEFRLDPDLSFEIDGATLPAGLRATDAHTLELIDCAFFSPDPKLRDHQSRAVQVGRAADGPAPTVTAERCLFAPGTVGLLVPAGATVRVADSGFAQHSACVLVEPLPPGEPAAATDVQFDRCSFMLDPRCAAVETPAPANVTVRTGDSVFAAAGGLGVAPVLAGSGANRRGVLVRTRGATPAGVRYGPLARGRASAFYSVDPVGTRDETLTFDDCRAAAPDIDPTAHTELRQRPWALPDPARALAGPEPWPAFALKIETDPQVFAPDGKRWVPLGAWFTHAPSGLHRTYPRLYESSVWPPPRPLSAEELARKVWFPNATDADVRPGVYKDLGALLKAARPDDVILIRHTGELPVGRAEIRAAAKAPNEPRLTFRPEPGSRPVLVVEGGNERDQTLFKLKAGEVTFENLHFVLSASRPRDGQTVAAVAVIGGRSCRFVNCTFTLAEEDESKVAAVHLPDIDKVMKMDPAQRLVPKVTFERCVVRGRGRGVWAEVGSPVALAVSDSLVALDGPVLYSEGGGKPGTGAASDAKFTRVTAVLGGPLVELRGSADGTKGSPVRCAVEADECLLIAATGAGRPLVELDGADPTDVKAVLAWQVKKPNRYANFEPSAVLAVIRPGGDAPAKEWGRDEWLAHAGEPAGAEKRFGQLLPAAPIEPKDLAALTPAGAAPKSSDFPDAIDPKALDAGTDLKALPVPPR